MPESINLEKLAATDEQIRGYFTSCYSQRVPLNLERLFEIAMNDKSLFPNMVKSKGFDYKSFIDRWVKGYLEADNSSTRVKHAIPKGSCNDPAIKAIVKKVTHISDEEATSQESHHNLFMSAENVQGALLEEYINSVVSKHGWIWCKGNTLRAVDFCTPDGKRLLQIKNKSNSENSSSSNIRSGTTIEKWFRLGTRKKAGKKNPDFKWEGLNRIIESASEMPCNLCEEDYVRYVEDVATNNPHLITDQ